MGGTGEELHDEQAGQERQAGHDDCFRHRPGERLGEFCRQRAIDLVVDCAQSLGCLPVRPEACHVAALASSGWKWLLGPWASGLLYTSPDFRRKLRPVMAGPGMMRQQLDYLDHRWNPHVDGRLFEYSTLAWDHAAGVLLLNEAGGKVARPDGQPYRVDEHLRRPYQHEPRASAARA